MSWYSPYGPLHQQSEEQCENESFNLSSITLNHILPPEAVPERQTNKSAQHTCLVRQNVDIYREPNG